MMKSPGRTNGGLQLTNPVSVKEAYGFEPEQSKTQTGRRETMPLFTAAVWWLRPIQRPVS